MVERVSGKPYLEFLRVNFFEPAGMTSTGSYGDSLGYSTERFAVGGGECPKGEPNIPPRWGPTSWLIMGSGGMVSNPADLYRWFTALRSGRILHGEALRLYLARGSAMGGTDRGFWFVHAWAGGDEMIFVAQNHGIDGRREVALLRAVIGLVDPEQEGEGSP
jgi:CubicO group peptidase (beta-lactamase class C family)